VYAYNCSAQVNLEANGVPLYGSNPGWVHADGIAYNWYGQQFYYMYEDDFCNGYRDSYYQGPTPC